MKNPNKIYTLTVEYNDDTEEIEYIEETISVDTSQEVKAKSILVDMSDDYWDEEAVKLLKDSYYLAEA